MGKKTFYTERDIQNLAAQGISNLLINDDVVLTELAWDTARALGIELVNETQSTADDLKTQIKRAVIAKLGPSRSIDDANLDAIISSVLGKMEK